jgi:hypothetical protein
MNPAEEMSTTFWRHGITVHMRVFELETFRAIQWWYPKQSGVLYIPKGRQFNPEFDGCQLTCEASMSNCYADLPDIPASVDIEQFHRDIEELATSVARAPADIMKNTQVVSDMLDLASSTSGNEIERKLTLHRAKQKLRAVTAFKTKI